MTKYTIANWTDSDCISTFYVLKIIQHKYVWNILAVLCLKWPKGFWELGRELQPISAKVLSQQLKILTHKKIVTKEIVMDWKVQRSIYTLSHKPEKFKKILLAFKEYVGDLDIVEG